MVVVYLKNGEKAPLPDANFVKIDTGPETGSETMLRCFFGQQEVGLFRWSEVAGYAVEAMSLPETSSPEAYDAWQHRSQSA